MTLEIANSLKKLQKRYKTVDDISLHNQHKVLKAYQKHNIALRHFSGTSGYGYDDIGRDTLAQVYADIFCTDTAIVSPLISSGTQALTIALFGMCKCGDTILSISGTPYDTLSGVLSGKAGSLSEYGIKYAQVDLVDGTFDTNAILSAIEQCQPAVIYIQRSRGYEWRNSIVSSQIGDVVREVRSVGCDATVMVDNCYGEFVEKTEPTEVGADVCIGSLIKNIGGGIANSGGYIVGKQQCIDRISARFTAPSVGTEIGSYALGYKDMYQGLFMAPHIVAQAVKTVLLFSDVMSERGYEVLPSIDDTLSDIVCAIKFGDKDKLISFVQSIQTMSPIDSHVVPYPWDMPGYGDQVIMAAGCFVQGASIELSCDGPIRPPYIAYLQGGLTAEHGILALEMALSQLDN